MALKLKTAPASEPVTLQEAKNHLRIDSSDEDLHIESLIKAARADCELFQNRSYISQVWELWLDVWPGGVFIELPMPPLIIPAVTAGSFVIGTTYRILTVGTTNFTLIGAASNAVGVIFTATGAGSGTGTATASGIVKYYDTDDTAYSMTVSHYIVDDKDQYAPRIHLAYGQSWPSTTLRPRNGICVQYCAGYGSSPSDVPRNVWLAMQLLIGHYYEHREEVVIGTGAALLPAGVVSLLTKEKVY